MRKICRTWQLALWSLGSWVLASPELQAAPENFNPSLQVVPSPSPQPVDLPFIAPAAQPLSSPAESGPPLTSDQATGQPLAILENIQVEYRSDSDNQGQSNTLIHPTAQFRLPNGNKLRLKSGFNTFTQRGVEPVSNVPLEIGWERQLGAVNLQTGVGLDLFDRLPATVNFNTRVEASVLPNVTVAAVLEQGPYKFNAATLNNQITARRYGPNLYWKLDPDTSFFSLFRWGNYNDGNTEQQSFSRLERKFGQFSLAANLFTWSYGQATQKSYFSPADFLVYTGELGWEGDIFSFLRCHLDGTLGQQRLSGNFTNTYGYRALCTVKIVPNLDLDLGYAFSNVVKQNNIGSQYNNQTFTGQLRMKF